MPISLLVPEPQSLAVSTFLSEQFYYTCLVRELFLGYFDVNHYNGLETF